MLSWYDRRHIAGPSLRLKTQRSAEPAQKNNFASSS
jgi:hypothetical protein